MRINFLLIFLVLLKMNALLPRASEFAVVTGTRVNLRSSPSLNSEIIGRLSLGQTVTVHERVSTQNPQSGLVGQWFRISIPVSVPVYVNASFIEDSKVTANQLNVRSGAGEDFAILARLSRGTRVSVVGKKNGWLTILPPPEAMAFVATEYLATVPQPPIVASPPPESAPKVVATTQTEALESKQRASVGLPARRPIEDPVDPASNRVEPASPEPTRLEKETTSTTNLSLTESRTTGRVVLKPREEKLNQVGISYRAGYSVSASIKSLAPIKSGVLLKSSVSRGLDRTYDDGFVGLDSSQNAGGLTWKWGYLDSSQISNDQLHQHAFTGELELETGNLRGADQQNGLELTYNRQLGAFGNSTNVFWGFLAGVSQNQWGIRDQGTFSANLSTVTDSYSLGGIIPPSAPFLPCCEGPGVPLIDDEPHRNFSYVPNGSSITGSRMFDADIYALRLGPYAQLPLGECIKLSVGMGLALGFVASEFAYDQTLEIPNSSLRINQTHRSSDHSVSPGWYADIHLLIPVYKALNATVGFQYQSLSDYQHNQGVDRVEMDLGQTHFFTIGLSYSY